MKQMKQPKRIKVSPMITLKTSSVEIHARNPWECKKLANIANDISDLTPVSTTCGDVKITAPVKHSSEAKDLLGECSNHTVEEIGGEGMKFKTRSKKLAYIFGGVLGVATISAIVYKGFKFYKRRKKPQIQLPQAPPNQMPLQPTWPGDFYEKFQMPELPPILQEIIDCCPDGYRDAALFLMLNLFGTFCFSRVRTISHEDSGKDHAPNFINILMAPFGAGKDKFGLLMDTFFRRIKARDRVKLQRVMDDENGVRLIIQYIGGSTTQSKFQEILGQNQGVHMFVWSSEVLELVRSGLTVDTICKSFENGETSRNNMAKNMTQGVYETNVNFFATGTPEGVKKFLTKNYEAGITSRVVCTSIPSVGQVLPRLNLPSEERVEAIRDQIDVWQDRYCYTTDEKGNDVAVNLEFIDLEYVNLALKEWSEVKQWKLITEGQGTVEATKRTGIRGRIWSIALHGAIVAHMMYGNPDESQIEKRRKVVDLALYLANYSMERYLCMTCGSGVQIQEWPNATSVTSVAERPSSVIDNEMATSGTTKSESPENDSHEPYSGSLPKDLVILMAQAYNPRINIGYGTLGKKFLRKKAKTAKKPVERALKKLAYELREKNPDELSQWEREFLDHMKRELQ